jgi:NADH-quinone oxidoreductase subunit H
LTFADTILGLLFAVLIYPGFLFIFILGIFFEGLRRKFVARAEGREGAPFLQPLYDLGKHWRKTTLVSGIGFVKPERTDEEIIVEEAKAYSVKSGLFFLPAIAILALVIAVAMLAVPFSLYPFQVTTDQPLQMDLIAVILLFLAPSVAATLFGTLGGSIYSQLAGSRAIQMYVGFLAPYIVSLTGVALVVGSLDLQKIANAQSNSVLGVKLVCGILYLIAMPVGLRLRPLNTSIGEGLEGLTTDISGTPLALFRLLEMLERVVSALIFATVFVPVANSNPAVFGGAILFYMGGLAIVETLFGHFKLKDALRFYVMYAGPMAVVWFALVAFVVKS